MAFIAGLQRAEVIDTSEFKELGLIRVRLLSADVPNVDRKVEVLTPFGGLPNMGMQALPPIGAHGMVSFEKENEKYGIWLGSVLLSYGKEQAEGTATPIEAESPNDFIIKTQYTTKLNQDVDSPDNKVENILKLNKDEITIAKVKQLDDQYVYHKDTYNLEEDAVNLIKLTDSSLKLKYKFDDNSKENSIEIKEEGINISYNSEVGTIGLSIEENEVQLKANGSVVRIKKDGDVEVNVPSGKYIKLNGSSNFATLYEGFRDFVQNVYNSHTHPTNNGPTFAPKIKGKTISAKSKSVKLT
jgi:hypothetical protein